MPRFFSLLDAAFMPQVSIVTMEEKFEFAEGWPGTIADPLYPDSYTGFTTTPTATELESFEFAEDWPGTT